MTRTAQIIWKKWQGEWAAYGPADLIVEGATVTVTKRSGKTSQEHIVEVHKAKPVDGVKMAYGLPGAPERPAQTKAEADDVMRQILAAAAAHNRRWETQQPTTQPGTCETCGTRRATVTATDHNGLAGRVCTPCAREIADGATIH